MADTKIQTGGALVMMVEGIVEPTSPVKDKEQRETGQFWFGVAYLGGRVSCRADPKQLTQCREGMRVRAVLGVAASRDGSFYPRSLVSVEPLI